MDYYFIDFEKTLQTRVVLPISNPTYSDNTFIIPNFCKEDIDFLSGIFCITLNYLNATLRVKLILQKSLTTYSQNFDSSVQ